jgi:hypothetical protein
MTNVTNETTTTTNVTNETTTTTNVMNATTTTTNVTNVTTTTTNANAMTNANEIIANETINEMTNKMTTTKSFMNVMIFVAINHKHVIVMNDSKKKLVNDLNFCELKYVNTKKNRTLSELKIS